MKYGIIGAMKEEISFFLESVEELTEVNKGLLSFYTGTWHGQEVVISKCGVGKVNAAMTAQILIDCFAAEAIIFTGVAGGADEQLNVEDVIVSTSCQQHDLDASPLGFARGTIPMYDGPSDFPADERLIRAAYAAASTVVGQPLKVRKGKIVSGDQFIADKKMVGELRQLFQASCIEMEGAAVAQVAHFNEVPYVVIRSISDKANGEAPESFEAFVVSAARASSKIVEEIMRQL
ncbi:adenosylhomocysteine nucleosidase [Evansella caseinilytica]|uniref:adenosylhomocysteine nucleosidase n=1 Tax=Evansella caseinilytica TaxID=1503961 RepID=A0A1H3RTT9_9BACI|nr:5'-methylthioadenosine/adenosylhomocysteine nucleosidase [Evansella caseinilytica]SDZ28671.1 adenosylhomocysteine nucleosidase [Evansella caseinilytica]